MLTPVDALNELHGLMKTPFWRAADIQVRANKLDLLCEGLGELYVKYMLTIGKPSDFILKATDLIVANSTKLGRILK